MTCNCMMVIILLYEFSPLKLFSDITHNVHKCISRSTGLPEAEG